MKHFNGREIAALMDLDSDDGEANVNTRILQRTRDGIGTDGYEADRVIVRHWDGKLYEFRFQYDTEHGIYPCREWPEELTEAFEVEPVETVTVVYRRIGKPPTVS